MEKLYNVGENFIVGNFSSNTAIRASSWKQIFLARENHCLEFLIAQ